MKRQNRPARKLLIASLGVAAVSYVACGGSDTSGNLVAPDQDAAVDAKEDTNANLDVVANLVAPDS